MRFLSFAAPSAVAVLLSALLCGPGVAAVPQTVVADASTLLPGISVEAPKQVARPQQPKPIENTAAYPNTSPTARPAPRTAPESITEKLSRLEKAASSCNGGCQTSLRQGDAPWVGCNNAADSSEAGNGFSSTCTDTLTHKTYVDCRETRVFTGSTQKEAWKLCSGLLAGGRLAGEIHQVAELNRARH